MQMNFNKNRTSISYWLIGAFILALGISASISALFQNSLQMPDNIGQFVIYNPSEIASINRLQFENQLGSVELEKRSDNNLWNLSKPRLLRANMETVQNILQALLDIKVLKIIRVDPINISHYSLDKPSLKITITNTEGKQQIMEFGFINPIDGSTYLKHSDHNDIFHIKAPSISLPSLVLTDFINSKIVPVAIEDIKQIQIFKGSIKQNQIHLSLSKVNEEWQGVNQRLLSTTKVKDFLTQLTELKTQTILDRITPNMQEVLDKALATPLYSMIVEDRQGQSATYTISGIINSIPDVKMEKKQNVIIQVSDRLSPYVVNKDVIKIFTQTQSSLQELTLKKIIY